MTDTAVPIVDLPAADLPLAAGALLELQIGTGEDSSQKITVEDLAAQLGGGGGSAWTTVTATGTMVAGVPERVTAACTRSLPETIAANDLFALHAQGGDVIIDTPHTIVHGADTICAPSDTLTVVQGETVYLLANSTSELGII